MKKIKKLSKGMTLVEVIVSMTIFALAAACIMSVIGGAMKISNRSRKRDLETAQQANAVKKLSDQETEVIGTEKDYTITFTPVDGIGAVKTKDDISVYAADAAQFGAEFGFQIRTFTSNTRNNISTDNSNSDEYKVTIQNDSSENITAYVEITDGYIYEGNTTSGYKHSSKSYVRTIQASDSADFGYCNSSFTRNISIRFVTDSGKTYGTYILNQTSFNASREKTYKYDSSGITEP